jgi:hypothetical protein
MKKFVFIVAGSSILGAAGYYIFKNWKRLTKVFRKREDERASEEAEEVVSHDEQDLGSSLHELREKYKAL